MALIDEKQAKKMRCLAELQARGISLPIMLRDAGHPRPETILPVLIPMSPTEPTDSEIIRCARALCAPITSELDKYEATGSN